MMEEENATRESSESMMWSEENQVYYYSKFDLFESDQSQNEFYQYSVFVEQVSMELGQEWRLEAGLLFSPLCGSQDVFMNLLELWLHHHPTLTSLRMSGNKNVTFNSAYVQEFITKMTEHTSQKGGKVLNQPPLTSVKAVVMGFFMTSNEIWENMFQEKNQKINLFSADGLIKGVTSTIEKTFRPLMVVTEKISSMLGRKKRKMNYETVEDCEAKFEDCYHDFKRTLNIEKQIERKLSQFSLNEEDEEIVSQSVIQKKQFKEEESPVGSNIIQNMYTYVAQFLNRNPSWQVASNFVTQILDLNQIKMEEGMKVKVMRPAEDFYHKLVVVWLLFKQNNNLQVEELTFQSYLQKLKSTVFVNSWKQKYILATKYFYERMNHDWEQIMQECKDKQGLSDKQVLQVFIRRIRSSMKKDWEKRIQIRKGKI